MKKIYILFLLAISVIAFLQFNCNSPTAPKGNTLPDTTSSNFTWQVDTIGAEGSVLYDVAVINDTLAYAVGLIMPSDSVERTNTIYWDNAAIWNGKYWKPIQVPFYYNGQKTFTTLYAIFAFAPNDILFSGGGEIEHWNGKTFSTDYSVNSLINGQINKIWGQSSMNFYVVGNAGTIVHYVNGNWTKVETGTTLPFQDIWGDGGQVLAVASSHNYLGRQLYSLHGSTATAISDSGLYYVFGGIWFSANKKYYVVGDGVFEKTSLQSPSWYRYPLGEVASYYSDAIRGNSLNDIVIAGDFADISHFNGSSWHEYNELYNPLDQLLSVAIKGNIIISVGSRYYDGIHNYGVIYLGRR